MNKCWMRVLKIILKQNLGSKARIITFGDNWPNEDLSIKVNINKYMSPVKDSCLITIQNLTYYQIVQIMTGKFYSVEVVCGYRYGNQFTVFKGGILRISNTLNDDRTNTVNILCGSDLIARYSQNSLNFNLNSGINVYSAIKFMAKMSGVKDADLNISTQFKKQVIQDNSSSNDTLGSFLSNLGNTNSSYIMNSDASNGSTFSIFDARKSNNRVITLKDVNFIGGYPSLTSEGLQFSILPSFNFMCGDVVIVDNSLITLENITSQSQISEQPGMYLDKNGAYMILEIKYTLQNRGSGFTCTIYSRARSLISNYIGV